METYMRRCNGENHEGPRYLPAKNFHKQGVRNGRQYYSSLCKTCKNAKLREQYHEGVRGRGKDPERKKAYLRARSKALTRLTKLVPELYERVLNEELAKEPIFSSERKNF